MSKFSIQNIQNTSIKIVNSLLEHKDIEALNKGEVIKDINSVLTNYANTEEYVTKEAQNTLTKYNLSREQFYKTKKTIAEKNGIEIGDYALGFLVKQIISMLMHSAFVDEVFSEDHVLQKHMRPAINELLNINKKHDAVIAKQIKHVEQGTQAWRIEYQKLKEKINNRNR